MFTTPSTSAVSATYQTRIISLLPVFERMSRNIPVSGLEPADLAQEMAVECLTKKGRLEDKPDGYLVITAKNAGWHAARKTWIYQKYVSGIEDNQQADSEDDEITAYEQTRSNEPSPERAAEEGETADKLIEAVLQLSPVNRQIIKRLYLGEKAKDIAAALGISPAAVCQRRETIAKAIGAALK